MDCPLRTSDPACGLWADGSYRSDLNAVSLQRFQCGKRSGIPWPQYNLTCFGNAAKTYDGWNGTLRLTYQFAGGQYLWQLQVDIKRSGGPRWTGIQMLPF